MMTRLQNFKDGGKVDFYLVSLYDNGLCFATHAAVNLVCDSHAQLVNPGVRWSRAGWKYGLVGRAKS